jgi:hypothetical protein
MSYRDDARADAVSTVENYQDEIVEALIDSGKAIDDLLNDYGSGDSYHHENHVDKWYDLTDAAKVLDELSDFEETDTGLWQGLEPRRAIGAQAAYTYGNAVYSEFRDLIDTINDNFDAELDQLQTEVRDDWDTAKCLDYIRQHNLDYDDSDDLDELRELVCDSDALKKEAAVAAIAGACE